MGQVIAFVSGKGGTGKTTLCAAIGGALSQLGMKVLCIDLDIALRNLDLPLGLQDTAPVSFLDVMSGSVKTEALSPHPRLPNLYFLTAPVDHTVPCPDFYQFLEALRGQFEFILLDASAGIDQSFHLAVERADRVIVVTQVDPTCLRDAQRTGQLARAYGPANVKLIVNRVNPKLYRRLVVNVDDMMDAVGLPLLGLVPEHPQVTVSAGWGIPLSLTRSSPAEACRRIARRLCGEQVPLGLR